MIVSPLRYPGGKAKLFPFFSELITLNGLFGSEYCEPYAGGAGLAIRLLTMGYVDSISINDIDQSIYSFWCSALQDTEKFCRLIDRTSEYWPVVPSERDLGGRRCRQYACPRVLRVFSQSDQSLRHHRGRWPDRRVRAERRVEGWRPYGQGQTDRELESLSRYARQIKITNLDALKFVKKKIERKNTLVYLDPPYYVKGHKLYKNFYKPEDHQRIAREMKSHRKAKWVVSYDDVPEIRKAYGTFDPISYSLSYSAGQKTIGREVIFLSDALEFPEVRGFAIAA